MSTFRPWSLNTVTFGLRMRTRRTSLCWSNDSAQSTSVYQYWWLSGGRCVFVSLWLYEQHGWDNISTAPPPLVTPTTHITLTALHGHTLIYSMYRSLFYLNGLLCNIFQRQRKVSQRKHGIQQHDVRCMTVCNQLLKSFPQRPRTTGISRHKHWLTTREPTSCLLSQSLIYICQQNILSGRSKQRENMAWLE